MHDHLGVALGVEGMAECLQFGNQLLVVIDLAVEYHNDRAVFVEQWLLTCRDVNDRQAAMPQADSRLDVQATLVRPAVPLRVVHALQNGTVDLAAAAGVKDSSDSAHGLSCSCQRLRMRCNCIS